MKAIYVIWFIIAFILVGMLTLYGFLLQSKYGEYYALEKKLTTAAEKYYEQYPNYLPAKSASIVSEKLIESNFLKPLQLWENLSEINEVGSYVDQCSGYVLVLKSGFKYQYKPYIKCEKYITKKYNDKYEENTLIPEVCSEDC